MPGEGACFLALFLNAQRRIRIRAHFGLDRYADHVLHVVHVSDMMMHRSPRRFMPMRVESGPRQLPLPHRFS